MYAQKVALVGFGTVGRSVAEILTTIPRSQLKLSHVLTRHPARDRVDWVPDDVRWTDRIEDVLQSDADIVVEVIGGTDPAESWILQSLDAGKSVVTANKQVIAHAGPALDLAARRRGRQLRFEAAVGGVVPVIRAVQEGLAGDRILRISGVLNGTCNFVLTKIEETGVSFDAALEEARKRGFAESDCSADIDGHDAAVKTAILASIAFGRVIDSSSIARRSIAGITADDFTYARTLGCTIRQVSFAEIDGLSNHVRAFVQPAFVLLTSALARARGNQNIVSLSSERSGELSLLGAGAGGNPTGVAVVSDLIAIARGASAAPWPTEESQAAVDCDCEVRHYIRFGTLPPDKRSAVFAHLAENGIEFTSLGIVANGELHSAEAVISDACNTRRLISLLEETASAGKVAPSVVLPILEEKK